MRCGESPPKNGPFDQTDPSGQSGDRNVPAVITSIIWGNILPGNSLLIGARCNYEA